MNETLDAISGLGLVLRQKRAGHRVGLDAVLLAASARPAGGRIVDVGAGVGSVGLALARRSPQALVDLVEIDEEIAALASENARTNGLVERIRVLAVDVMSAPLRRAAGLIDGAASLVVTNPPFYSPGETRVSPDAARARAHALVEGSDTLSAWLTASLALLAPGGCFAMIHRPEALPAIYSGIGRRLGDIAVLPVFPREGEDAIRVIVTGVKGSRAPARLRPGLVLHQPDGQATARAQALHEGRETL